MQAAEPSPADNGEQSARDGGEQETQQNIESRRKFSVQTGLYEGLTRDDVGAFADSKGMLDGKAFKQMFSELGFQCTESELEVLTEDLKFNKCDELGVLELIEYMSKRGLSNWLPKEQALEMDECIREVVSDGGKSGKISVQELQKLFLDYLPDHIFDAQQIAEKLENVPAKFLKDGQFDFAGYMANITALP